VKINNRSGRRRPLSIRHHAPVDQLRATFSRTVLLRSAIGIVMSK